MTSPKRLAVHLVANSSPAERALIAAGDSSITRWLLSKSPAGTVPGDLSSSQTDAICALVESTIHRLPRVDSYLPCDCCD